MDGESYVLGCEVAYFLAVFLATGLSDSLESESLLDDDELSEEEICLFLFFLNLSTTITEFFFSSTF